MWKAPFVGCLILAAGCIDFWNDDDGGSGQTSSPVEIQTQSLDQGNVSHTYFQTLQAQGGRRPYSWWISSTGDPLPTGLDLTADGELAGVPVQPGTASVVIVAQDANSALDLITLQIEVRDVEITPAVTSHVPPGTQFAFQASGGQAGYSFSMLASMSGGNVTPGGLYTAGSSDGIDLVRAVDADGFYEDLGITVGNDPFIGFQENYGTTDVWWMDWDVVYDPSQTYATDIDEVLVALGLRDPQSTDVAGTEADQLARLLVIRRTLGHLSTYYGNGFDGSPLPDGLSISFVGPAGPASGITPTVGDVWSAGTDRYNTICVRYGPDTSVVGTAWLDPGNDSVEHNCGDPTGTPLGIFANRLLQPYLAGYGNSIAAQPVNATDVAGLRELLYGTAPANGRQQVIFDVADGYGRTLAAVLAHEIGHSLGLTHPGTPDGLGDLMRAQLVISPSVTYRFSGSDWAVLFGNLPGPRR
ncbi:MAG: putative Ig domain-containing protein [Planctomycetota bacterium]|jgi:hypothetical protein